MKICVGSDSVYLNEINVSFRSTRFVHMGKLFCTDRVIPPLPQTAPKGKAQAREREREAGCA